MSQYYISPTNNKGLHLLDVVFVKSGMIKVLLTVITDKAKTEAACVEENNDQHTVVTCATFRYLSVVC